MGHLFPGGTEPTSGSEFRSRVIFRLECGPHPSVFAKKLRRTPSPQRGRDEDEEECLKL